MQCKMLQMTMTSLEQITQMLLLHTRSFFQIYQKTKGKTRIQKAVRQLIMSVLILHVQHFHTQDPTEKSDKNNTLLKYILSANNNIRKYPINPKMISFFIKILTYGSCLLFLFQKPLSLAISFTDNNIIESNYFSN